VTDAADAYCSTDDDLYAVKRLDAVACRDRLATSTATANTLAATASPMAATADSMAATTNASSATADTMAATADSMAATTNASSATADTMAAATTEYLRIKRTFSDSESAPNSGPYTDVPAPATTSEYVQIERTFSDSESAQNIDASSFFDEATWRLVQTAFTEDDVSQTFPNGHRMPFKNTVELQTNARTALVPTQFCVKTALSGILARKLSPEDVVNVKKLLENIRIRSMSRGASMGRNITIFPGKSSCTVCRKKETYIKDTKAISNLAGDSVGGPELIECSSLIAQCSCNRDVAAVCSNGHTSAVPNQLSSRLCKNMSKSFKHVPGTRLFTFLGNFRQSVRAKFQNRRVRAKIDQNDYTDHQSDRCAAQRRSRLRLRDRLAVCKTVFVNVVSKPGASLKMGCRLVGARLVKRRNDFCWLVGELKVV
jgi:hypothetical protein